MFKMFGYAVGLPVKGEERQSLSGTSSKQSMGIYGDHLKTGNMQDAISRRFTCLKCLGMM